MGRIQGRLAKGSANVGGCAVAVGGGGGGGGGV